jgi:hypothetical protein
MIELEFLHAESCREKWEVGSFDHCDELFLLIDTILVEGGHWNEN